MPNQISKRHSKNAEPVLPRDVAGHTITADDFLEDDDYTEQVLENDARMIAFLSKRKRAQKTPDHP